MVALPELLCPVFKEHIKTGTSWGSCAKGHKFTIRNSIIDLLANIDDEVLQEEEKTLGSLHKRKNKYRRIHIKTKIFKDYNTLFYRCITNEWPDYFQTIFVWSK